MISLPVANYPVVEDTDEDSHIDQNDLNVTLTYAEHEMICDVLLRASDIMYFACPSGFHDMPIDSELIQRYSLIENLREKFNVFWEDRFSKT